MLPKIQNATDIHVVGISGTEGAAVALFLRQHGLDFTAHDFADRAKFKPSFDKSHFGIPAKKRQEILTKLGKLKGDCCGKNYLRGIEKADLIFVSQNWEAYAPNKKLHRIFARNPDKFMTLTQVLFGLFPGKIIAVTGTNGKSTTTKIIAEIMQCSRQKSWFTGNDRRNIQILNCLDKCKKKDWLVVEVSNRQLKFDLARAPNIAVITNVTANHLDDHGGSFKKYKAVKYALLREQTSSDIAVLNYDDPATREFAKQVKSTPIFFSTQKKLPKGVYSTNQFVYSNVDSTKRVCPLDKICLLGAHNHANILAAIAAARAAGASWSAIQKTIKNLRGLPQRLELVKQSRGVRFIDDSYSTTPDSTIAALRSFPPGKVRLIAGGGAKGMDYALLAREIKQRAVRVVLIESPAGESLGQELKRQKVEFETVATLRQAVTRAASGAKKGECILLSPAAAWFIYFAGKMPCGGWGFREFVNKLS